MLIEAVNLVTLALGFSLKSLTPSGSMVFLDFHTITPMIEATASFKQRRPAFQRVVSDLTLSESLHFVIVLATYLMVLLISSVMQIKDLSSFSSLMGMVAGAAARILCTLVEEVPLKSDPFLHNFWCHKLEIFSVAGS